MKRIVKIGIAVLTAIVVLGLVVGCDNGTTSKTSEYTIAFDLNGGPGIPPATIKVKSGKTADTAFPSNPADWDKEGETQKFEGWFENAAGTGTAVTKSTVIKKNYILYAKWGTTGIVTTSDDASLDSVKFGLDGITLAEPGATLNAAKAAAVTLLQANATVTAVPSNSRAEVEFLQVAEGGTPDESEFWSDTVFDFTSGDTLYIRVTAEDGVTKLYYKFSIMLGDVALTSLKVGGKDVGTMPLGGTTWRTASLGAFVLFQTLVSEQPAEGIEIEAEAEEGATIQYAKAKPGVEPNGWSDATKIKFEDNDLLYLKVTGKSKSVGYYKVEVSFKRSGKIKYGSPVIGYGTTKENTKLAKKTTEGAVDDGLPPDDAATTKGFIDPIWNDPELEVYPIDRIYGADSTQMINGGVGGQYIDENGKSRTVATAKALWDEEGLSIFLKVIDSDVVIADNGNHECDSLELFVNEDITFSGTGAAMYSNGGSQYRVGAGGRRSGEGGWNVLRDLNKTAAWKASQAVDGFDGYYVLLKAPWRLRTKFFDTTTYRNDWKFGFELQVNVGPTGTGRYGVQIWNNIAHTNYQNALDYGIATMFGGPANPNYPPLPPVFTTNPKSSIVGFGQNVNLTVATATPKDGGIVTLQWYNATDATAEGTAISGATNATYQLTAPNQETKLYYYAVATNTNAAGTKATTMSSRSVLTVTNAPMVEQFTLAQNNPVYKFSLTDDFSNYKSITVDYYMDPAEFAKGIRAVRLMGNYAETDFTTTVNGYPHFGFDAANAAYIYDDRGAAYINGNATATPPVVGVGKADAWFTAIYRLNGTTGNPDDSNKPSSLIGDKPNPNGSFTHAPAANARGPLLFGVGLPGNASAAKTQLIKNITIVHATDSTKNVKVKADDFVGYASADSMMISGRDFAADPAEVVVPVPDGPVPTLIGAPGDAKGTIKLTADTKTIEVRNERSNTNIGFWYPLPTTDHPWYEYGKVTLTFTANIVDGTGGTQITAKKGKAINLGDFASSGQYHSLAQGETSLTLTISSALALEGYKGLDAAIAFQVNSYSGSGDVEKKMYFDVLCTKIELTEWAGVFVPPVEVETKEVTITMDLTKAIPDTITTGPSGNPLATITPGTSVTFDYTSAATNTYGLIPFTDEQIAVLKTADTAQKIKIDVQGTSTVVASGADSKFRYCIGNPTRSSGWNATVQPGSAEFASLTGEKEYNFDNKETVVTNDLYGYFILRLDTASSSGTVTITSVTIKVQVPK